MRPNSRLLHCGVWLITVFCYCVSAVLCVVLLNSFGYAEHPGISDLPSYKPHKIDGQKLTSVGSDSMGGLLSIWVDAYKEHQPKMGISLVSRGSASAPAALLEGRADLGPMARPMKSSEREDFRRKTGLEPIQIRTALAAVGIYASKNNPVEKISFRKLDGIFSSEFRRNGKPLSTWKELGVKSDRSLDKIVAVGRVRDSYPNAYFRQQVMLLGEFGAKVMTTVDQKSMVQTLSANQNAIAYGELSLELLGDQEPGLKLLSVSREPGSEACAPTYDNLITGRYPLSRYLNIYVIREPGQSFDESLKDFLGFVLSKQGQEIVQSQGFIPLPLSVVQEELAKLR